MGKRLHVAQTERKPAPAPASVLNNDLLKYVAADITRAKASLEPRLFHAAVNLLESPSAPVAPIPTRATGQPMIDAATAQWQRAQLETTRAARVGVAHAALETSAAQARAAQTSAANARSTGRQAAARTQYWHAQIQRFGIGSYARHYEDQNDFKTRSAQPHSSGEALHPVLLEALEAHFQQKLPAIQIHSDSSAASRAREVGALAFTSGAGIHFGAGQYQPFTTAGFKLLVHETAHVLQQASGIVPDGVDTDPSLESAAQLEASRVTNAPSLSNANKPQVSSQPSSSLPFETAGQWAAHLLNTLKQHSVPRERFAVVAELYSSIPVDQQGKARALMLGKLNPNSSEHQRLESALVVAPTVNTVKPSGSSATQGKPRQPGEMNFFTYLNPLERDVVLPNYKAFPVSSDTVKASPALETAVALSSRSAASPSRSAARVTNIQRATEPGFALQRDPVKPVAPAAQPAVKGTSLNLRGAAFNAKYPVKLRSSMDASSKSNVVAEIKFGTTFLITESISSWYKIKLDSGQTGYVAGENISVAPDAKATFYQIKAGDNAIDIAQKHYKAKLGLDLRFYVGVLAKLNPKSIKMPSDQVSWGDASSVTAWKNANPLVGFYIWIPSPAYAASLKGSVNNGKLSDHPLEAAAEVGKGIVKKTIADLGGKEIIKTLEGIGQNVSLIWDNPGAFMTNLQKSFSQGFGNFQTNFDVHLKTGVMDWLQSALGANFTIPKEPDAAGLLSVGLQVVGLDYTKNLRPMLLSGLPSGGLTQLEASGGVLSDVVKTGSLTPVMQMVQSREKAFAEMLEGLPNTILSSLKDFAIKAIVTAGVKKMLSMLVPGGGLVQAAINIYNAITFFMDRAKQIGAFVQNLTSSFAKIAKGDIPGAVKTVEGVLGSGLSLALGFLASAAGLTKIASSIKTALNKIQIPAKKVLEKIAAWFKRMFSSLMKKVTPGSKPVTPTTAKPKDPDHDKKVAKGLAQIDFEEAKIDAKDNDSKLTKAQATQVAAIVKSNNPIFTKIIVHYEVAKNEINYEWFASNGIRKSNRKPYTDDLEPDAKEGTKTNPFPINWPKPASVDYPKIYLGGKRSDYKSQNELKNLVGQPDDTGTIVQEYTPHSVSQLSNGHTIGLGTNWHLGIGTVVGPLKALGVARSEKAQITFREMLKGYGFRGERSKDDLQIDHIHELQLGGADNYRNLWPLQSSINGSAGALLDNYLVTLKSGAVVKVYQLREYVAKSNRVIYFSVQSVR